MEKNLDETEPRFSEQILTLRHIGVPLYNPNMWLKLDKFSSVNNIWSTYCCCFLGFHDVSFPISLVDVTTNKKKEIKQ